MNSSKIQNIDILVLSDKKPGHFNQSLGIVECLPSKSSLTIEIRFKSLFRRSVLYLCCLLNISNWQIIRWALVLTSFNELEGVRPKVILSTGSTVAPLNYILGRLYPSRTAVCMRSGILNQGKRFDLAILPYHDRSRIIKNAVYLLGTPNRITDELLTRESEKILPHLKKRDVRKIGLLLGGTSSSSCVLISQVETIVRQLKEYASKNSIGLLLTTSRRTPRDVEEFLENNLSLEEFVIYGLYNGKSGENPVAGILGISDIVFVTEDSYSMVSEAASSGKPVFVLRVSRCFGRKLKYDSSLDEMEKKGVITRVNPEEIALKLGETIQKGVFTRERLKDSRIAAREVESLLG